VFTGNRRLHAYLAAIFWPKQLHNIRSMFAFWRVESLVYLHDGV
jgi:hypothetical protein